MVDLYLPNNYNYIVGVTTGMGRCLGMRSRGARCALHDPNAEGALVLYAPIELTAHEKLTVDK